jgi:striatin 1/3/4
MAWQSLSGMGGGGNGGGNGGGEAGQQANQPQGTEYTLQGMLLCSIWTLVAS